MQLFITGFLVSLSLLDLRTLNIAMVRTGIQCNSPTQTVLNTPAPDTLYPIPRCLLPSSAL